MIAITSLMCFVAALVPEDGSTLSLPKVNSSVVSPATVAPEAIEKQNLDFPITLVPLAEPEMDLPEPASQKIEAKLIKAPLDEENIPVEKTAMSVASEEPIAENTPAETASTKTMQINMQEVFFGAPVIYSILALMSLGAMTLWLYHMMMLREEKLMPSEFASKVENNLAVGNWQEALSSCRKEMGLLSVLVQAAITARHEGSHAMIERMQTEGKRATCFFWQRLSLLNDIALIAPMIGLLGTVIGMFYAFYDVNRTVDSMYALFDGLGISVGTTVAGLILAIVALFFHSTLKYRLVRQLSSVEAKAQKIALHPSSIAAHNENANLKDSHEFNT
jgi:biopolymer transport protein ExbB